MRTNTIGNSYLGYDKMRHVKFSGGFRKKRKIQQSKKRKNNKMKRTRRFRKQYGGRLNEQQIEYIQEQIKDIGFTDAEKIEIMGYFHEISQHVSKQSVPSHKTVLETFFDNVNSNVRTSPGQKRRIFLGLLNFMYRVGVGKSDTDHEDEDDD